jgi:hypothetical protein
MNVNLSRTSWHARYYEFCAEKQPEFRNLCPYFWTIVFFVSIFPIFIGAYLLKQAFGKRGKVAEIIGGTKVGIKYSEFVDRNERKFQRGREICGKIFLWFYLGLLGGGTLVFGIISLFIDKGFTMAMLYIFAFIGFLTVAIILVWLFVKATSSDTFKMVSGMIKAKKDKVCPAIDWE